jgi:putative hydrolase of the HAD superfamily
MRYQAVVFDLFGTLVPNFSVSEYRRVLEEMAHALGAPAEEFARVWTATFEERVLGLADGTAGDVKGVCARLGSIPSDERVAKAVRLRLEFTRRQLVPRDGAVETVAALRARGHRIALITDCTNEAPALWRETPLAPLFDETVFSCLVHMKKPDPEIYRLACSRLQVIPERCLYVGDGGSRELSGAAQVGLHPVMLRPPHEDGDDVHRVDPEGWAGPVVATLAEVLELVG